MTQRTRTVLLAATACGLVAVAVATRPSVRPPAERAVADRSALGARGRERSPAGAPAVLGRDAAPEVRGDPGVPGPPPPSSDGQTAGPRVGPGGRLPDGPPPRAADVPVPAGQDPQGVSPSPASTPPNRRVVGPATVRPASPPPSPPSGPVDGESTIPLPLARDALTMVGADPEAEAVWVQALNDPALPPNARKDLIEDLNEAGFEDPKHVTLDDVPLIVSRLALIEDLAPDAMDDVNYAAFAEAYKDLVNMLDKATRP